MVKQTGCKIVATGAVSWSPASGEVAHDKVTMRFGADTETATYAYENLDWSNHAEWTRGAAPPPGSKLPTSQTFYIGNGGEYRKSYHGMPPGTAQVVASPSVFHIQPMQIDTKNRDGSMETPEQGFTPGPYPKSAVAPRTGPDATYSGLLVSPRATLRHPPPASLLTPPPARFGRNARAPIASRRSSTRPSPRSTPASAAPPPRPRRSATPPPPCSGSPRRPTTPAKAATCRAAAPSRGGGSRAPSSSTPARRPSRAAAAGRSR